VLTAKVVAFNRTVGAGVQQQVDVSTDVTEADWNTFVEASPAATGYHLWGWRRIFERVFRHPTEYLVARQGGRIVGALPLVHFRSRLFGRFAVSLPFVNYGGILSSDPVVARALLERATVTARERGLAHVELRHSRQLFPDLPAKRHKVTMLLDLPSSEAAAWENLDRKVRNQVRKAERSGLTVEAGGSELLKNFYSVFAENMRDLGTPVYPRRLFFDVVETFPERSRVFLIRQGSKPVAGAVSFAYRKTIEVPWAASLKAARAVSANMLLYWTIIRAAIADHFTTFDFGRSTPDEGTFYFKRQWGAAPRPLCWEYRILVGGELPDHSPKNPKFQTAIAVWKRLPVPIATLIGPHIVRSIP